MQEPLEIVFRDVPRTEALENLISEEIGKLEKVHTNITGARVAVEKRQSHQWGGSPLLVRVELHVPPSHHLVAEHCPGEGGRHDSLETIIRSTFKAARRRLSKLVEKERGETKTHPEQELRGVVTKLFPEEGYGFLESIEGREVYFHKNSVLQDGFDSLEIGTGVAFTEETGASGPQASTVRVVDSRGHEPGW
jgi:cold shock CspA family protein/ribosome-associated translation inhibitor RaiA